MLGFVAGILIPGASESSTDLTHAVQQELATAFSQAAKELAEKLSLDTTGMSGPDKVFAITKALIATAEAQGIKADVSIITDRPYAVGGELGPSTGIYFDPTCAEPKPGDPISWQGGSAWMNGVLWRRLDYEFNPAAPLH